MIHSWLKATRSKGFNIPTLSNYAYAPTVIDRSNKSIWHRAPTFFKQRSIIWFPQFANYVRNGVIGLIREEEFEKSEAKRKAKIESKRKSRGVEEDDRSLSEQIRLARLGQGSDRPRNRPKTQLIYQLHIQLAHGSYKVDSCDIDYDLKADVLRVSFAFKKYYQIVNLIISFGGIPIYTLGLCDLKDYQNVGLGKVCSFTVAFRDLEAYED